MLSKHKFASSLVIIYVTRTVIVMIMIPTTQYWNDPNYDTATATSLLLLVTVLKVRSIYTERFIVWQPRRAADTSKNWRQTLFCCCTASMEPATDRAETAAIGGLISLWSENISVSFCLRAPGYRLTLWCSLGLLVGGAIQVPQLQKGMSDWAFYNHSHYYYYYYHHHHHNYCNDSV